MSAPIRVLVVDDSALMRKMVREILSSDDSIEVVGQARNGAEALDKLAELSPDVVTLDIEMPVMNGIEALGKIMETRPTPVIMVSSHTRAGADTTFRCLSAGAIDFVTKPNGSISIELERVAQDLIAKVKIASQSKLATRGVEPVKAPGPRPLRAGLRSKLKAFDVVVIGASTGGPRALHALMPRIPGDLGVPIVIVQHLPALFTSAFALKLDSESPYSVKEARFGDSLQPGVALVARGGVHLKFDERGAVTLSEDPPLHGVRPAIDVTVDSLIRIYGARMLCVLLTGMGRDGAMGLKAVKDRGGFTIAEHESTCVVYGMPRAAFEAGAVCQMLPGHEIADAIVEAVLGNSLIGARKAS